MRQMLEYADSGWIRLMLTVQDESMACYHACRMVKHLFRLSDTAAGMVVALAATLLINLPLWNGLLFAGESLRPDVVVESTDEKFYLARINEVADGYLWAGHPFLFERREQRYPLGNLWEAALGLPMRWLHLDIKTTAAAADAFFPFVLVLLLWMATRPVLSDRHWRLLLISVLFLGAELTWWKRPISPQQTMILPLLYFWMLFSSRRTHMLPTAVRGALIGLMTLSYPFHWTFTLAAEGLFTLWLWLHDKTWTARLTRIMVLAVPLALCALPWLVMMLSVQGDTAYAETLTRLGMLDRRIPSGLPLQALVIGVMAAVWSIRRRAVDTRLGSVLLILLGASLLVLNQPLITGKEAEFSSHYRQIIVFPLWIALLWAVSTALKNRQRLRVIVPLCGLAFIAIQTVQTLSAQWTQYDQTRSDYPAREQTNKMMAMLHRLPPEQVILSERDIALNMAVYTSHYPYFAHETHMYLMDNEEIWRRAAVQAAFFPDQQINPRAIVGSSYLNKALHERTRCLLHSLLPNNTASCDVPAEAYLPQRWREFPLSTPSQAEALDAIRQAGVSYTVMREIPAWLLPHGDLIDQAANYQLFRFDWSSPSPNLE